jgi:hypothetical protein
LVPGATGPNALADIAPVVDSPCHPEIWRHAVAVTDARTKRAAGVCLAWACLVPVGVLFLGFVMIVIGFLVWATIEAGWPWGVLFAIGLVAGGVVTLVCGRALCLQCRRENEAGR